MLIFECVNVDGDKWRVILGFLPFWLSYNMKSWQSLFAYTNTIYYTYTTELLFIPQTKDTTILLQRDKALNIYSVYTFRCYKISCCGGWITFNSPMSRSIVVRITRDLFLSTFVRKWKKENRFVRKKYLCFCVSLLYGSIQVK